MSKKIKLPFQFAANMLELDSLFNPYPEAPVDAPRDTKVSFESLNHKYCLYDANGSYPDDIISASKVFDDFLGNKSGFVMSPHKFESTVPVLSGVLHGYLETIASCRGSLPLDFNSREQLFNSLQKAKVKNFSQFFPSSMFVALESHIKKRKAEGNPLLEYNKRQHIEEGNPVEEFVQYLHHERETLDEVEDPEIKSHLLEFIAISGVKLTPRTGRDIVRGYGVARDAGTALHAYLESRALGVPPEEARVLAPCREDSDYSQVDYFLKKNSITHVEKKFASLRHKICGTADGIYVDEKGVHHIHDWKRVPVFNSEAWFIEGRNPNLSNLCLSHRLVGYSVQLATYRKLDLLNGAKEVSEIAYIQVFHPTLGKYRTVTLDLSQKLKPLKKTKELHVCNHDLTKECFSPIELVEIIFAEREFYLKRKINTN